MFCFEENLRKVTSWPRKCTPASQVELCSNFQLLCFNTRMVMKGGYDKVHNTSVSPLFHLFIQKQHKINAFRHLQCKLFTF